MLTLSLVQEFYTSKGLIVVYLDISYPAERVPIGSAQSPPQYISKNTFKNNTSKMQQNSIYFHIFPIYNTDIIEWHSRIFGHVASHRESSYRHRTITAQSITTQLRIFSRVLVRCDASSCVICIIVSVLYVLLCCISIYFVAGSQAKIYCHSDLTL